MRFLLRFFLVLQVFTCFTFYAIAQGTTSKGTEFYTTWMDHKDGAGSSGSQMNLYITSDVNTTAKVDLADGSFSQSFSITANQVTTVAIPLSAFLGSLTGTLPGKGIHITAEQPVAVYAHIYAKNVSGATLLLPVKTLGKDYISINYTQVDRTGGNKPAYSTFDIIAADDNTSVEITPSADLTGGQPAGIPFTISLAKKGDVYQCQSASDLTGSRIKSVSVDNNVCKPIAVFSGSSKLSITSNGSSGDNLFQQAYPTSAWGKNFVTVPLATRDYDIFRVIFSDPTTVISGIPSYSPADIAKGYVEFSSNTPNVIIADKPIQVVQYSITQAVNSTDRGDPEMIFLNPVEQGLNHVTLFSTDQYQIKNGFINVTIKQTAVSSFLIDGQPAPFTNIAGSIYAYAQIPVSINSAHNISANSIFNAIAYGFGNVESYGYSAGTNVQDFSRSITLKAPAASAPVTTFGCSDVDYQVSLTLPFKIYSITWGFDGATEVTQNITPPAPVLNNGIEEYKYDFTTTKRFASGIHDITASYINPSVDCGNESLDYQVTIADPPVASFSFSKVCLGDNTVFQYTGTTDAGNVYNWDFGDGSPASAQQNPSHLYVSGDYVAKLTVTGGSGCTAVSQAAIHISKKPTAAFTVAPINCANIPIAFTDQSTDPEGNTPLIYKWDFGDGGVSIDKDPNHTFTAAGTYTVKLIVTNSKGCSSEVYPKNILIHSTPVANFTSPDVCLADIRATFTSTSTINDGTDAGFTYVWDFGDGATSTTLTKTTTHQYSHVGTYHPKLTVISNNNCESPAAINELIVNKSDPKTPVFDLVNLPPFCSANPVIIKDASEAETGDVLSKIVINWGDGTIDSYLRQQMHTDKVYMHTYALFHNPISQTFKITLETYTGGTCMKAKSQDIVVYANPVITLNAPSQVCQEAGVVNIIEVKNTFAGTGVFSGTGVSPTGIFDPYKSGAGTFNINYLFTSDVTGCTFSATKQITVNPTPKADAGPDQTFLDGNQITLQGTASGNDLTYLWTPSTGLSNDKILTPIASPKDNTMYTLTVTSANGCTSSSTTNIYVLKMPDIPNTFTPNNDGRNDLWKIEYLSDYKDATVEVYTRSGEKVFSSIGYSVPWDGTYKGTELPVGVYYYIINPKSGRKAMAGYVTIIK